jgi:hypothetical protein
MIEVTYSYKYWGWVRILSSYIHFAFQLNILCIKPHLLMGEFESTREEKY